MKKHYFMVMLLVAMSVSLGFYRMRSTIQGSLNDRNIASIKDGKIFNFKTSTADLMTSDLSQKVRISTLLVEREKVIALNGFSSHLCESFNKIELVFEAYGVAVAGEAPALKITADCIPAQDPAEIAQIRIPFEKLLKERPRNAEFSFSGYPAQFELTHSDDQWSKTWILNRIVFKSNTSNKMVQADRLSEQQSVILDL